MNNKSVRSTFSFIIVILLLLFLIKVFDLSYPLSIVTSTRSSELAVVGEGKIDIVPDTSYVQLGINVNNAATVEEAQNTINDINNKIVAGMTTLKIAKTEIKTSNYSIYPNYDYSQAGQNRITGYNGNVTITVKVKDIRLVSKVIEEGTKAGANQVQGTQFTVDNPEKYREEARNKAIQNAKQQAAQLAKTLGIKLGKIVNVVESTPTSSYTPLLRSATDGIGGGGSPQIEPGSQTISSVVTLYFEKR